MTDDLKYMRRAVNLAKRGAGWVNPNPMVGAVLVRYDRIIGEGFHEFFGGSHAEVNAINGVPSDQVAGSTLYVTLEPCAHEGKTAPCVNLIIERKIAKVVIGMTDPNPLVDGKGIAFLRSAGIQVQVGLMEQIVRQMNEVFVKYIRTGKPFVVLKTAMTLDGKIATVTNASRWITGEKSRKMVHLLRQNLSAVMVGVDTVLFDDPLLNIRMKGTWKNPLKVIADTHGRIAMENKVLTNDPQLTIIATTALADPQKLKQIERAGAQILICPLKDNRVDLGFVIHTLGKMGIDSVMIEGGSTLAFSALKEGVVDKVISFIAPKILGGASAPTAVGGVGIDKMENAINLTKLKFKKVGEDLMIEGWIR
ncbi:MAG: bifunctional diaminohydroxyphosphoribosylaminopyrimidine deaminase/5-amino-6-(5-phosphoribosylamino)uracil reductase RibD [Bacteroidales bacterium]|nr:bifunctional diaminohydroxyphosphoribosylaminopyrimidine deaminase/5-amino-6-(5-phosphoribosylamino)uracil reductase RibD [Bacteroidales bacterium]